MIIESVQISGFGCISSEYNFCEGMNLIVAGNESGKTTLADALVSILYGLRFAGQRGGNGYQLSRKYTPAVGESFAGSAVVRTGDGRRLNIWRDFVLGKLRVLELASGRDITLEFDSPPNGDCLGQRLTGLSAGQYRKLAFLSQDELNKEWDFVEFVDSLSALFSTDDTGGVSIEEARAALDESVNLYEGMTGKGRLKVDTEIKRLEDRIAAVDGEISEISKAFAAVEKRFEEAADRRSASEKIRNSIIKYDYLNCLLQRDELGEKLGVREEARSEVTLIEGEIAELSGVKDFEYDDLEHITELMTLCTDKRERIKDVLSLKDTRIEEYDYLKRRVENLGKRSNITQEYLVRIEQAIAVLENNLGRERSIRIDCRSAEAMMAEAGVKADELQRFNKWREDSRDIEVEFVANYTRIREQIENREHGLKNERQEHLNVLKDIGNERMYRYRFSRNNLILGCIFTGLSVFFFVAMGFMPFMLIPAVSCLGWAVFGAFRLIGVQNIGRDEEGDAREEIERIDSLLQEFPEKFSKMEEKLESFASSVGVSRDGLLDLLQRINKAQKEVLHFQQRIDRHRSVESVIGESYATLKEIFCEIGIADDTTSIDVARARVFLREVSDALSLIEQYEVVKEARDGLIVQESELMGDISELEGELDDIFARAGVEVVDADYVCAAGIFKERLDSLRRLEQLERVALPAAIKAAGDSEEIAVVQSEITTWSERIERMLEKDPWLEAYKPEKTILEYSSEIKLLRLKLEDSEGELVEREKALAVEEGRRRERLPLLRDEDAKLRMALKKALRFRDAVTRALSVFDSISNQLHARWSPIFSGEFNKYIERFSSRMEFSLSKELKICGVLRENGQPVESSEIPEYLSKGMRDQVYLSLRLLLAQRVAAVEALPVILDDPFINADDRRFEEGMEQLLELSEENQIFIFSCHELRHEKLCVDHPEFTGALLRL